MEGNGHLDLDSANILRNVRDGIGMCGRSTGSLLFLFDSNGSFRAFKMCVLELLKESEDFVVGEEGGMGIYDLTCVSWLLLFHDGK